jgi:dienelactone hydrolase
MKRLLAIVFASLLACLAASAAQAEIKTQWVDYKEGDTALQGYLAYDDGISGKRPGILLLHRRDGMSDLTLANAKMYAQQCYVVFAPDIFGKDIRPKTVPEMQAQTALYTANRPLMRARAQAGFDVLRSNPMVDPSRIATVGYCFGGQVAVEFAETGAPIVGSVAIHGSFRGYPDEAARNIHGPVLILHGAEDPVAPLSEVIAPDRPIARRQGRLRAQPLQRHRARLLDAEGRRRRTRRQRIQGGCRAVLQTGVRAVTACRSARGCNTSRSTAAPGDRPPASATAAS